MRVPRLVMAERGGYGEIAGRVVRASREADVKANRARHVGRIESRLKDIQHECLVAVASGEPLADVMKLLCLRAEEVAPTAICSIIRVDAEGRLRPLAAPSLPDGYSQGLDGALIGPMVGSCGSAAYLGVPVEVTNIRSDPRWSDFRERALALGLRACWSSPISSHDGRVIGTFAFYFRAPRRASRREKLIVKRCAHLCALAIENWEAHAHIRRLAYTDPVTDLGNRAHLDVKAPEILERAREEGRHVAVYYVDLDGFRSVNSMRGHRDGDRLLSRVAERIRDFASDFDLAARIGADEFVLVRTEREGNGDLEDAARRLAGALRGRYALETAEVRTTASIGAACFPINGDDLDDLIGHADTALRRVKRSGRSGYAFYSAEMDAEKHASRAFERDVSAAVAANQLSVVYQPQASARTRAIHGFEALLRWKHPIHGDVPPGKFIPAAEACGAIEEVGAYVLREALAQAAKWPPHLRVAVNVSPAQIVSAGFSDMVADALAKSGVFPPRLEIEVTESLFIGDAGATLTTLEKLKSLGVSVAIDDFGTGYSSLSTLRAFPFDRIKIDRSFVFDMVANSDAAAIVNSILGLGRGMGRPIIAEGVETMPQLELLQLLGCSEVQGYLIGKPLAIEHYAPVTTAQATPSLPTGGVHQGASLAV